MANLVDCLYCQVTPLIIEGDQLFVEDRNDPTAIKYYWLNKTEIQELYAR